MGALTHLTGAKGKPFTFRVEEGKVAEFVRAVHATDPLFLDAEAAANAGLSGVLAPPTFSAASAHWSPADAGPSLDLDMSRVLAGGGEWEYLSPLVVGDELVAVTEVESVVDKNGSRGPMTVIRLRTEFSREGTVVQTYTSTVIQLGTDGVGEH